MTRLMKTDFYITDEFYYLNWLFKLNMRVIIYYGA